QLAPARPVPEPAKSPSVCVGPCRQIAAADAEARIAAGDAFVTRCKVPSDGTTEFDDSIHGHMTFANAELGDFVIARADGSPLYNFANVVDDAAMKITHIIRGNDHLSNTPRQVVLYRVLGHDVPLFAHIPMVLGPDGSKLSKRKHHTSTIEQLALEGYVPAGVRNAIALIGWNRDDDTTEMSTDEMVAAFDISRVKKSPAAVDYDKMKHINALHLRKMTPAEFGAAYEDWRTNWLPADDPLRGAADAVTPEQAALLVQEKVDLLAGVPPYVEFLLEPFAINDAAWEKLVAVPDAELVLEHMIEQLGALDTFSVDSVEAVLRGACEQLERKPRVVFAPVRFAITGRTVSPGLFESIFVLGKDRALARLADALARLKAAAVSA
ncbi:MAG: glutamate--tRNA ligase, partial [Thermoleophilia bacterium]|nr:glutamate--tRNA ligase [Thermoleophilia bacterium]